MGRKKGKEYSFDGLLWFAKKEIKLGLKESEPKIKKKEVLKRKKKKNVFGY